MSKPGTAKRRPRRAVCRPMLSRLEDRVLPTGVNWQAALGIGVSGQYSTIKSNAVATDSSGDTYITGSFRGTAEFNPGSSSSTITTNNTQDTFVAKYGPTGSLLWVKTFAGTTTTTNNVTISAVSQGSAIAVDGSGNVFVAGAFSGTVNLTGLAGTTSISTPTATTEIDLVKLDSSGNLSWVDTVAGTATDDDEADALTLDGTGGVIMAGWFADSATFGSTVLSAGGASDAFVSRVNGSGQFVWSVASQGQSGSNAQVTGVAVDGSGNVALSGLFSGSVDFDPSSSVTRLVSNGSNDALIWKLSSAGSFAWVRSFGAADYDTATAVAVDPQGNLYATGAFSDTVTFGTTSITAGPIFDAFAIKLSSAGTALWADGMVGPGGWSKGQGIAIDPYGNVELGGTFSGLIHFNPGSSTNNLTSVGSSDVFALGLDSNGNTIYALQAGLTNFNATLGVSVNSSGLVAATGTYSGSIAFGSTTLPAIGVASAFVAMLAAPGPPPVAPSAPILDSSSDTGLSSIDGITSATSPLLDINTAIAGDTVELIRNNVIVGTRVGPGSIRDLGPLTQGVYSYTAIQLAPYGTASVAGAATSVTVLTTPPAAPPAPTLYSGDDSGTSGDGITNVRQPRLLVMAVANTTVQLSYGSGTLIGSTFASNAGTVTILLSQVLADGTYAIQARLLDLAGNISATSLVFSLTILATPPPAPSTPSILPADVTGAPGGSLTNVRQPRLIGTAKTGTTVQILTTAGTLLSTATASSGGYTARIATSLSDGTYTVHAISIDAAANQSVVSPNLTFTIDGTPPVAPAGLTLLSVDDSGVKSDGITNIRQPRLTGTAEVGSTVQIIDSTGKIDASAITGGNGVFTDAISSALSDGPYSLQARAIDLAGNTGPASATYLLTILGTPPSAPPAPALYAADDSGGPNLTNVNQPRMTGSATANTTVQILGATGILYATVGSGRSGSYLVKILNPLADGTYSLHAVATDVAGNVSAAGSSLSLTILTTPPATPSIPTLLPADDSGTLGDNITNVRQPRLTGTATAGLTIRLLNATGTVLGTTTAGLSGAFTIAPGSPLGDGTYTFHFVGIDAAGNVSLAGPTSSLVILATPPPALNPPTLLSADIAVGSAGSITPFSYPTIVGIAAAGDQVSWVNALGTVVASAKASTLNGSFALQAPFILTNRSYPIAIRQTDVAGNASVLSGTFNMTVRVDPGDNFGNSVTDLSVVNTSSLAFSVQNPVTNALFSKILGSSGDVPVSGNFYGNGHEDIAIYRPSTSTFYVFDPVTGASESVQFGLRGDIPIPGDFDGDGRTDIAVFRPSNNTFYAIMSASGNVYSKTFALIGDIPVPADYYGNGHDDIAVYRPSTSTFYVVDPLTSAYEVVALGLPNSTPIPADYEGFGHADFAVFEPGLCDFVIKLSATNVTYVKTFALAGDIPVPGDYFGDGHADLGVFRPSTATFYEFEIANSAYRVNIWGTPGQVRPVLSPITTWFSFGSIGTTGAIRINAGSSFASNQFPLTVEVVATDPIETTIVRKKGSTGQSLSLESWRP